MRNPRISRILQRFSKTASQIEILNYIKIYFIFQMISIHDYLNGTIKWALPFSLWTMCEEHDPCYSQDYRHFRYLFSWNGSSQGSENLIVKICRVHMEWLNDVNADWVVDSGCMTDLWCFDLIFTANDLMSEECCFFPQPLSLKIVERIYAKQTQAKIHTSL